MQALLLGSTGCQPVLFGSLPKSSLNVRCVWFLQAVGSRRQAADDCRLAACAPRSVVTSSLSPSLRPRPRSGMRPRCRQNSRARYEFDRQHRWTGAFACIKPLCRGDGGLVA